MSLAPPFIPARWRLALIVGGVLLLLAVSIGFALHNEGEYRQQVAASADVQARVLGQTATAALSFGDRAQALDYVKALQANPGTEAAALYDLTGARVASFGATPARLNSPPRETTMSAGSRVTVTSPVLQGDVRLGAVYLRTHAEPLSRRLSRYAGPTLLILTASLMFIALGIYARALARVNDELKREIAERAAVEAALRQSQKMEAIGRLTGGIAHDFNNMLSIIIGSLDILRRRIKVEDPKVARLLDGAAEGARRAADVTQRLLAFSRQQPLDPKAADVGKIVRDLSTLLVRSLGEHITLETVIAAGLWPAFIDASQLEAAILNLAINARDAMPTGGKLTIECGNAFLAQPYADQFEELKPGQYVLVAVTDTGSGIPAEVLSKIFDPFFTTKPSGVGTGLGLSQVHGFVKQSGGHVAVYSEPGVGTTMKLYLPRSEVPVAAAPPEPRHARGGLRKNVRILIVEDDPGVLEFASEAAAELGYDTVLASTEADAVSAVERHPDLAIVLTDVIMPGINGRQLADRLKARKPELNVIFMTGYTQNAIVHNGMLDPGTHLLTKPFTVEELGRALEIEARRLGPAKTNAPTP